MPPRAQGGGSEIKTEQHGASRRKPPEDQMDLNRRGWPASETKQITRRRQCGRIRRSKRRRDPSRARRGDFRSRGGGDNALLEKCDDAARVIVGGVRILMIVRMRMAVRRVDHVSVQMGVRRGRNREQPERKDQSGQKPRDHTLVATHVAMGTVCEHGDCVMGNAAVRRLYLIRE